MMDSVDLEYESEELEENEEHHVQIASQRQTNSENSDSESEAESITPSVQYNKNNRILYEEFFNTAGDKSYDEAARKAQSSSSTSLNNKQRILNFEILLQGISNIYIDKRMDRDQIYNTFHKVSHLHLQRKKLDALMSLAEFKSLSVLYLYENKIREITGLEKVINLELLDLHENLIERITGLERCEKLKELHLGQNRITIVEGLKNVPIVQLYIENQKIPDGEMLLFDPATLDSLAKSLKVLDISGNNVETIEDLAGLDLLEELISRDNKIFELDKTTLVLTTLNGLRKLDFRKNPIVKCIKYREKMIGYTKLIENLDAKDISPITRTSIQRFWAMKTANLKFAIESSCMQPNFGENFYGNDNVHNDHMYGGDGSQMPQQDYYNTNQWMNPLGMRMNNGTDTMTPNNMNNPAGCNMNLNKSNLRRIQTTPKIPVSPTTERLARLRQAFSSPVVSTPAPAKLTSTTLLNKISQHLRDKNSSTNNYKELGQAPEPSSALVQKGSSRRLLKSDEIPNPQFVLATPNFLKNEQEYSSGNNKDNSCSARSASSSSSVNSSSSVMESGSKKWTTILSPIPAVGETEDDEEEEENVQRKNEAGDDGFDLKNKVRGNKSTSQTSINSKTLVQKQEQSIDNYNNGGVEDNNNGYWMQEQPQFESNVYSLPPWPHIKRLGARQPIITFIP